MRPLRLLRLGIVTTAVAGLLATGVTAQAGAATTGSAPAASGPTQTVQLALTPRDRAGLQQLAEQAPDLSTASRRARLAQVIAGPDRANLVATRARALGFTVTSTDPTWVTIAGPASLVTAYFGSARAQNPSSGVGQALPSLPTSLRGLVTVAAGGDETRPAFRPSDVTFGPRASQPLTQSDFRAVYNIPGATGKPTSTSPAIATLQFSNWNSSDLTQYAQTTGVYGGDTSYDPVASGGYSEVRIDGGPANANGAVEVSLDQSALATVAPRFRQIAYLAPNTATEQAKMLNRIALDASSSGIYAVSTSWGACEFEAYSGSSGAMRRAADQDAVNAALAAGVTVFAATGDNGPLDCSQQANQNVVSVDVPAAIPGVVSVGGTTVTRNGSAYAETGWAGSGGGFSTMFCASAAQAAILPPSATKTTCPFGKARGVPDIAMDADPNTGLMIFSNGVPKLVGGTSLSAPLAAGSLAQTLLTTNFQAGVGDVSSVIQSSNGTSAFRDVVGSAGPGWDAVTGSGAPNWTVLGARITGRTLTNSIYDVTTDGPGGFAQVRELSAASGYQSVVKSIQTPLIANSGNWTFFFAPYNRDGMRDLYAIATSNTASGMVEVHVLSEASAYQSYVAHIATALPSIAGGQWQFALGSFGGDGDSDLYAIHYASNASNTVEVHTLSAASSYQTWIGHAASALPALPVGPTNWDFFVGDSGGRGDLITVIPTSTGSGKVEVHTLTQGSGYRVFSLHVATPQPAFDPSAMGPVSFCVSDFTGDNRPDIAFALFGNTGSTRTEMHGFDGATSYTTYALHTSTALPYLDPTTNTISIVR